MRAKAPGKSKSKSKGKSSKGKDKDESDDKEEGEGSGAGDKSDDESDKDGDGDGNGKGEGEDGEDAESLPGEDDDGTVGDGSHTLDPDLPGEASLGDYASSNVDAGQFEDLFNAIRDAADEAGRLAAHVSERRSWLSTRQRQRPTLTDAARMPPRCRGGSDRFAVRVRRRWSQWPQQTGRRAASASPSPQSVRQPPGWLWRCVR